MDKDFTKIPENAESKASDREKENIPYSKLPLPIR